MILDEQQPLVSCIMPTYNRRKFIPLAIKYFLKQDYANKELIIIDDGSESIEDLIPGSQGIRYFRLPQKITLGAKLNLACGYADGKIIAHWDDDDWYAARRLSYQVDALRSIKIDLCGLNRLLYYDLRNQNAYQYIYPPDQRTWLLGSSLCYSKSLWNSNHFADINVGMDGLFVWGTPVDHIKVLTDPSISVHMIHNDNISPKQTKGGWWHNYPGDEIETIMATDLDPYSNQELTPVKQNIQVHDYHKSETISPSRKLNNVYACLVHESEDCVIDLVHNLHYQDPESSIILYNGGTDTNLFQRHFPYEKFGAFLHPKPAPVRYGYLHNFALHCMKFALENLSIDTLTIVDSDQLSIRPNYSGYISTFLSSVNNAGLLSSNPVPVAQNNTTNHVALQAFKEYDLWKPFIKNFSQWESKFVHWSFWPSTVFTADAIRDLTALFDENLQLREIMMQTKIWATEEVILPTLVSLLGYEIVANPCSYEFVKFKKPISHQDVSYALQKDPAYWIHPIIRKYNDPLRKYIREQFKQYAVEDLEKTNGNPPPSDFFQTLPLIEKIRKIEGWLFDREAELLIATTIKACKQLDPPHHIVEIGSYHGKSTVLFGTVIDKLFPEAKIFAIDTHDGMLGAADKGLQTFPPSYEMFKRNIEHAEISHVVEIIKGKSYNIKWEDPISLLFVDGLHDYTNVERDFHHFSDWIRPGGYVAFHDYAIYFPGVQAFVHELLELGAYRKIDKVESLMVLQKI